MADFHKVLFAYIEEDNLQRAFFAVRPLLTLDGQLVTDHVQRWPEMGTLRIVPDRNEQLYFKSRIRSIGHYCMIDMARFPSTVHKIRTNKNYDGDSEINQHIIYSDAIFSLPPDVFYEVIPKAEWQAAEAVTPMVFLEDEAGLYGPMLKDNPAESAEPTRLVWEKHEVTCPDGKVRTLVCNPDGYRAEAIHGHSFDEYQDDPSAEVRCAMPHNHEWSRNVSAKHSEEDKIHERERMSFNREAIEDGSRRRPRNHLQGLVVHHLKDQMEPPPVEPLPDDIKSQRVENPVEMASDFLGKAWEAFELRPQLAEMILALPGVEQYMTPGGCKEKETPLARALKKQLRSIEAERLALLIQLDKTKEDVSAYRARVIRELEAESAKRIVVLQQTESELSDAIARQKEELSALMAHQSLVEEVISASGSDDSAEALSKYLLAVRGMCLARGGGDVICVRAVPGETLEKGTVIERVADALHHSGMKMHQDVVTGITVAVSISPVIGVVCECVETIVALCENLLRRLGWGSSYVFRIRPGQQVAFANQGKEFSPVVVISAIPDGSEIQGAKEIIIASSLEEITSSARYKLRPYPVMQVIPTNHVPVLQLEDNASVLDAASLSDVGSCVDEEMKSTARQVLSPVFGRMEPLPGPLMDQVCQFVAAAAPLMEGGLAFACDVAILLWLLPLMCARQMPKEKLINELLEYPVSRRFIGC